MVGYFAVKDLQEVLLHVPPKCGTTEDQEIAFAMSHGDFGVDLDGHPMVFFHNSTNTMFIGYEWVDLGEEQRSQVRDYWRSLTRDAQKKLLIPTAFQNV